MQISITHTAGYYGRTNVWRRFFVQGLEEQAARDKNLTNMCLLQSLKPEFQRQVLVI